MSKGLLKLMSAASRRSAYSNYTKEYNYDKDDYVKKTYPENYEAYLRNKKKKGN